MTEKIRQYPITTIAFIVGCFIIICAAFVVLPSKVLANQANTKDDTSQQKQNLKPKLTNLLTQHKTLTNFLESYMLKLEVIGFLMKSKNMSVQLF